MVIDCSERNAEFRHVPCHRGALMIEVTDNTCRWEVAWRGIPRISALRGNSIDIRSVSQAGTLIS